MNIIVNSIQMCLYTAFHTL